MTSWMRGCMRLPIVASMARRSAVRHPAALTRGGADSVHELQPQHRRGEASLERRDALHDMLRRIDRSSQAGLSEGLSHASPRRGSPVLLDLRAPGMPTERDPGKD